ncbi:MAG TPA: hypothetical protein ENH37_06985 [Deltaproteobacteria bacterium]|nr:hypothetical protein [Deltaproteobacteria bacterium]
MKQAGFTQDTEQWVKRIFQVLWFVSIILVSYLSLTPRIQIPYEFSGADKLGHFLAYLWLAVLPFYVFKRPRSALMGALLMIVLGVGLEFAQIHVPGRNFSLWDMAADCAGAVAGILVSGRVKRSDMRLAGEN